jgi:hypothetical protein
MTDWATLADVGTAVGTLILAGATFVAVRAATRSRAGQAFAGRPRSGQTWLYKLQHGYTCRRDR